MKKWLSVLMALTLTFSAVACGKDAGADANAPTDSPVQGEAEAADDSQISETEDMETESEAEAAKTDTGETVSDGRTVYPVTLTDQLGREVTIEKEPQTLVSGYYISTSLLLALGCQDRLVGVEAKAGSRAIYRLSAPALIDLPSVGSAKEFDLEGCAALHPDLVVIPARAKDSIPALEELGLTVLAVNPEDQELLGEAALLLGEATNTLSAADSLLQFQAEQLSALEEALKGTDAPSVYLSSNSSLLAAAGPQMYQNSLITNAGGTNAAAELTDDYWAEISWEQLLAWDPEYIILAADADYTVESVMSDPNLSGCRAVKDGHVFMLPNAIESWDSPVPGSVLGSLWMGSILHPEEYPDSQWKDAAAHFYETFYGFSPDLENLYEEE